MRIFPKYFVFNLGRRVEGWREIPYFYKTKYLCKKFKSPSTTSTFGKVLDATHQHRCRRENPLDAARRC